MKKAIIGAGGFANEVKLYVGEDNIPMFVDDIFYEKNNKNIFPLSTFNPEEYEVVVAIGDPIIRKNIVEKLPTNTKYFTVIHPSALIIDSNIKIADGSIVCPGVILTSNVIIGKHTQLNILSTVGHDSFVGDFFTTAPGAKISGNCNIGNCVYVGTNASIKQKLTICDNVTIGLNSGVVKNILESGVYGGIPAKKIK